MLLRTIICIVLGLFGLTSIGCAGLGVSQQSRLEIAEPARSLIVRPQGLFFSPPRVTLTRGADGSLGVRTLSATTGKWAHEPPTSDTALSQLHDALLPFLVPACEAAPLPSR